MKESIILVGGGGHCRSVIDVIESEGRFSIAGIIDREEMKGTSVLGYQVLGTDADLPSMVQQYRNFHITVGHIRSAEARIRLYRAVKEQGGIFPSIVSPSSTVSRHARIGEGSVVMHRCVVNAGASVGANCIINTAAVIEHDARIHDHCHISTGAFVNGECSVGEGSFIGSNSTLVQCVQVAPGNVVAAGAVLTRNTEPQSMYAGNPATLKKQLHTS